MLIFATLQMNGAAATVVVWVIGSQTVQNWRQYRISRPRTLDGVTTLLAMLLITKSHVPHCALSGNRGSSYRYDADYSPCRKILDWCLLCLVMFSQKMPICLLEKMSCEADFTHENTFIILKLILCVLLEFGEW